MKKEKLLEIAKDNAWNLGLPKTETMQLIDIIFLYIDDLE